jgi:hypothetical protein
VIHEDAATRACYALGIYLALGDSRSLVRLHAELKLSLIAVSIATLKRWSVRYNWAERVEKHSNEVVAAIELASREHLARKLRHELGEIHGAQSELMTEILTNTIGPSPGVPRHRKRRELSVRDFCRLLKAEHDLLKCCDRNPAISSTPPDSASRLAEQFKAVDLPD